ncbi:hypothetical protein [Natronorubrum thiooxidans]|nr:hypothetical protein [Natronorubrum thiooxidans]
MTDETSSVSRRNVLAGLGTIGVGGALVGAGTGAFFSDKETFKDNRLVAGALDLKVDWQEHYSDWSKDELEGLEYDPVMEEPENSEKYVGFPTQAEEYLLWVHEKDVAQFMNNTAIEAFPDILEEGDKYDAIQADFDDDRACELLASVEDYERKEYSALTSPLRTQGTFGGDPDENGSNIDYPNPQMTEPGDPLIDIEDVKPGDFGELTLSFHLCDNPGYVWLTGELLDASENGLTEPEAEDPDEQDGVVELLDEILVQFWMDNYEGEWRENIDAERGDNIYQDQEKLLFPEPLTLREALTLLETEDDGIGIPLNPGNNNENNGSTLTPGTCDTSGYDDRSTSLEDFPGDTPQDRRKQTNPFCTDYGLTEAIKIEADFDPNNPEAPLLPEPGNCATYTTAYGDISVCLDEDGNVTSWETDASPDGSFAGDEDGFCVDKVLVKGGTPSEGSANVYHYDDPGSSGDNRPEEDPLTTPTEQDISNVSFCISLEPSNGNGDRECFVNSTTQYVGFSWWLPVNHANEIQTDSVSFDIGFYTEQCRHNDGTGMRKSPKGVEGHKTNE